MYAAVQHPIIHKEMKTQEIHHVALYWWRYAALL